MKKILKWKKRIKLPYVLSFITFCLGVFFYWNSQGDPWLFRYKIVLLGFLPFLFFLSCSILISIFSSKTVHDFIYCFLYLLIISLFFYYPIAIVLSAIIESENPICDSKYYSYKVNNDWLLQAFPKEIPNNVENVHFWYAPGVLQGDTQISLYYIDRHIDLESFVSLYKEKAVWSGYWYQYNKAKYDLDELFSHTPIENKNINDFFLFLIDGHCDNSGYCNHGDYLVTGVNEKTNEIIYTASYW